MKSLTKHHLFDFGKMRTKYFLPGIFFLCVLACLRIGFYIFTERKVPTGHAVQRTIFGQKKTEMEWVNGQRQGTY